jgi:hypothetical protein
VAKVIGYHACERTFAEKLKTNELTIAQWAPSQNDYDWLGHGIYFWEANSRRAKEWAAEHIKGEAAIIEAEIDLGLCFDLPSSEYVVLLSIVYASAVVVYQQRGKPLPTNEAGGGKLRRLDCLIINEFLRMMDNGRGLPPIRFQTVRCPFEEGEPIFPGSMIRRQTHIQIAVRDYNCIRITDFDVR